MLMRPDHPTCDLIKGVLGRAQARYQMRIVAFVFLSNHFHLLLLPDSPQQMALFMAYLASNLAREVGRVRQWKEKFWSRRYRAIPVSVEDAAQIGRLRYLMAHGAKEGLVARAQDWPGPSSIPALLDGAAIGGTWFDRSQEYRARRKGVECSSRDFAFSENVTLTPLPCWASWPESRRREMVAELLAAIEREAEIMRAGKPPIGRETILRQQPNEPPPAGKRSRAPAFHVATRAARDELRQAYRAFVKAFWRASERLRAGDRSALFPAGSFPPALPYVPIPTG
jgi:hypothetical protein